MGERPGKVGIVRARTVCLIPIPVHEKATGVYIERFAHRAKDGRAVLPHSPSCLSG